jgi:hypothetical protein
MDIVLPHNERLERGAGLEPASTAWKAGAQPIYQPRALCIYLTSLNE